MLHTTAGIGRHIAKSRMRARLAATT